MRTKVWTIALTTCALAACGDDDDGSRPSFGSFGSFGTGGTGGDEYADADAEVGDGDGDSAGDGDPAGDGEGGDGDGDPPGDGDGDPTTGDGDPTTGGDPTTDDGDGAPEIVPCDIPAIILEPVVPHVVLVLDKSGSMVANTWDHDANPGTPKVTRWKSLHSVVAGLVNEFDDQFEFGAQLFPAVSATNKYDISACLYETPPEVPIAPNNATGVLLGIPVGTSLNIRGGTPTAAGVLSAVDHLLTVADGDPEAIILVTDGAANCRFDAFSEFDRFETYDPNLEVIVADAYDNLGIPTYVVGIDIKDAITPITGINGHPPDGEPDGISPSAQLDALALAGGRPRGGVTEFYQTQNQLELAAAIAAIVDDAASCTIALDPSPPFPDLVEVIVDGQPVPQVGDCASEDGWVFSQANGPYDSIELCGSWCEELGGAQDIAAEYYCNPG